MSNFIYDLFTPQFGDSLRHDFHQFKDWFILTGKFHDLRTDYQITVK